MSPVSQYFPIFSPACNESFDAKLSILCYNDPKPELGSGLPGRWRRRPTLPGSYFKEGASEKLVNNKLPNCTHHLLYPCLHDVIYERCHTWPVIKISRGHWCQVARAADLTGHIAGDGDSGETVWQQWTCVTVTVYRRFPTYEERFPCYTCC